MTDWTWAEATRPELPDEYETDSDGDLMRDGQPFAILADDETAELYAADGLRAILSLEEIKALAAWVANMEDE